MRFTKTQLSLTLGVAGLLTAASLQAATITPNITTDPALVGPGVGTDCSLRYAIESINNGAFEGGCAAVATGALGTGDTVVLGANTYTLTLSGGEDNNATGDLDLGEDAVIQGAGSGSTTIDASGIDGGDRVFDLDYLASNISITGVTITGGDASGADGFDGGGLQISTQNVVLDDVRVTGNAAGSNGGGIFIEEVEGEPAVLINNSTIADNEAVSGGGIYILEGTVGISNSTISGNDAVDGSGGGIFIEDFAVFLTNSTISGNTATSDGGGIFTVSNGTSNGLKGSYNVTITLNQAEGDGGGIASNDFPAPQGGQFPFATRIFNTIVAENTSDGDGQDCANGNFPSGGFNLIGQIDPNDFCNNFVNGTNGDQVGTTAAPIDPLLGPLQDNGGPTFTHALLTGSTAIDRANGFGCEAADVQAFIDSGAETFNPLTTDQRGETRPVAILNPDEPICDIGAYELQVTEPTPTPSVTPIVTPTPPPFVGLIEGSGIGCSLNPAEAASSAGTLWMALGSMAGLYGLRRKARK